MSGVEDGPLNEQRLSVAQAADALGISAEAVRMRIKRGTLRSEREHGAVYVILDADQTRPHAERTTDRTADLIASLEARIADVRGQLEEANTRDRENRRIIAALTQ